MAVFVRCFPSDDVAFHEEVARRARHLPDASPREMRDALQDALADLRDSYPLLRVRVADSLAAAVEGEVVVYVFRDGSAYRLPRDGPGAMRRESDRARVFLAAAEALARNEELREDAEEFAEEARLARETHERLREGTLTKA